MRWLLLCCCLLLSGCLSKPVVEGTVSLDGKPIDGGGILLHPISSTTGANVGSDITAGKFRFAGSSAPPLGKHRVVIHWVRKTGRMVPVPTNPNGPERIEEIGDTVPAKYNSQSTLEVEIKPGVNRFEWNLLTEM